MARRQQRRPRKHHPCRGPRGNAKRRDQRRWLREAREFIAVTLERGQRKTCEPHTENDEKLRRLLISIAAFLEPDRCERLGADGIWGVFQTLRDLAEQRSRPEDPAKRLSR